MSDEASFYLNGSVNRQIFDIGLDVNHRHLHSAVFQTFILSKICYNKFKLEQLCLLKVKGFQTPDKIRENMMRQLTTILKELFKFKKKRVMPKFSGTFEKLLGL